MVCRSDLAGVVEEGIERKPAAKKVFGDMDKRICVPYARDLMEVPRTPVR